MSVVLPPRVARGATVGIVAPAGPVRQIRLDRGLARFGDAFTWKLAPSLVSPPDSRRAVAGPAREEGLQSYLSGSDEQRAEELTAMLRDPDVRAIILARGGYGIMRILPMLDPAVLRADPKPIVGFSDATALLSWAHLAGVRSIHGPVVAQMSDLGDNDIRTLIALLTDPAPPGVRPWQLTSHSHGSGGRVQGPLIPANLTLAAVLLGTPWALPLAGSIALFEEVGERPYELDRYFTQLSLAGALAEAQALVLGDLTRCEDMNPSTGERDPPDAALQVVIERMRNVGRPLVVGAPVGHAARNEPLPFGAPAELDLDHATIAILEGAVS
ncbi:MAG TPA: LD-carboxypeptidase [Kofleriaceae bacterium]